MLKKSYSLNILIYLTLLISTNEQQCILGKNCPYNQGICVSDVCNCYPGYETLVDEFLPPEQQISCNYKKISQYIPIILEVILPSMGHFYVGKYWLGLIKLSLIIIFVSSSFYLYGNLKFPELFDSLFEIIGFGGILGIEKKEEEGEGDGDGDGDKDGDNGEEKNEEEQGIIKLRGRKKSKQANYVVKKQTHANENEVAENERRLLEEKNEKNKSECRQKTVKIIFELSGTFLSLLYFMDLFLYKFNVYTDGNGVSFA